MVKLIENTPKGFNMLFFNKALRTEKKIIDELHKYVRKSKKITSKTDGNKEVYYLDNIDISFDVKTKVLRATDKRGVEIVAMNCDFTQDLDQQRKFDWFSHLLNTAREAYDKKEAQKAKIKKMQKAKKNIDNILAVEEKFRIVAAQESLRKLEKLK